MIMANDDMILSFIEGDKKLELSIKGYEFDEYFKQIQGEFDTSDQDSEWLMIKAVYSECGMHFYVSFQKSWSRFLFAAIS